MGFAGHDQTLAVHFVEKIPSDPSFAGGTSVSSHPSFKLRMHRQSPVPKSRSSRYLPGSGN